MPDVSFTGLVQQADNLLRMEITAARAGGDAMGEPNLEEVRTLISMMSARYKEVVGNWNILVQAHYQLKQELETANAELENVQQALEAQESDRLLRSRPSWEEMSDRLIRSRRNWEEVPDEPQIRENDAKLIRTFEGGF